MKKDIDIISWQTYKKRYNPSLWVVWDGVKGWVRDVVCATLRHHGWIECAQKYDYGLFGKNSFTDETPKEMAISAVIDFHGEDFCRDKKFVYYPYKYSGNNNYMDALYVYYKDKNQHPTVD